MFHVNSGCYGNRSIPVRLSCHTAIFHSYDAKIQMTRQMQNGSHSLPVQSGDARVTTLEAFGNDARAKVAQCSICSLFRVLLQR